MREHRPRGHHEVEPLDLTRVGREPRPGRRYGRRKTRTEPVRDRAYQHPTTPAARVAVLPGADPADLITAGRAAELREHLTTGAVPLIHLVIDDALASHNLEHIEGRVAAVRAAAHQIAPTGAPGAAIAAARLTTVLDGQLAATTITTVLLEALTTP